jgi:hypothetical protein
MRPFILKMDHTYHIYRDEKAVNEGHNFLIVLIASM